MPTTFKQHTWSSRIGYELIESPRQVSLECDGGNGRPKSCRLVLSPGAELRGSQATLLPGNLPQCLKQLNS